MSGSDTSAELRSGPALKRASALRRTRSAVRHLLWLWVPASLLTVASLMVAHTVRLPQPEAHDPALAAALDTLRPADRAPSWLAAHVLYAACDCSKRLLDHLTSRPSPSGVDEVLLIAGDGAAFAARARAAGMSAVVVEPEDLQQRFNVTSAPLLAVADPAGQVRYVGGYTPGKQGADPQDVEIITALQRELSIAQLPVLGCAVSRELQAMLDPLGLKYRKGS